MLFCSPYNMMIAQYETIFGYAFLISRVYAQYAVLKYEQFRHL